MVRRARKGDSDAVGRLWIDLLQSQSKLDSRFQPSDDALQRWRNDFPEWVRRDSRRIYVAEGDGAIRGFVSAERWSTPPIYRDVREIYIDELYVEPAYRRRGLGRALVEEVALWAKSEGAHRLRAGALGANGEGRTFWERVGAEAFTVTYTLEVQEPEEPPIRRGKLGF